MKHVCRFPMALLFGLAWMNGAGWAQDVKATTMTGEIRRYELLMQETPAQNSGAMWWKLAMLHQDAAQYRDAEHAYGKALELLKTGDRATLANVMDGMGTMYVETGWYVKAEALERNALALREAQNDSAGIGVSWMHLAMLSLGKHEVADAARYAELAADRLVPERKGMAHTDAATPEQKMTALIYLSLARCAQRDFSAALPELALARTLARASYPAQNFPVAYIDFLSGYAQWKSGKNERAAELMKTGTAGMEAQLGWGHPTYISAMKQYEAFLKRTRRNAEAAEVKAKIDRATAPQRGADVARGETMLDKVASK